MKAYGQALIDLAMVKAICEASNLELEHGESEAQRVAERDELRARVLELAELLED